MPDPEAISVWHCSLFRFGHDCGNAVRLAAAIPPLPSQILVCCRSNRRDLPLSTGVQGTPSVRNKRPILSPMRASPNQDSNPPGRPQSPRKSNRLARKTDRSHAAWLPGEVKIVNAATTPGRAPNPVPPSQELPLRSGGGLCRLSRPRPGNVSPTAMHREPCECPGLVSAPALSRVLPLPTIHWIFPKITAVFRGIITILANEWTDFSSLIPVAGATPPPQPVASRSPAAVALHKSRSLPGGCPSLGHRIRPAVTPRIRGRGSKHSATKIGDPPVAAVHIPKDTRAAGNSSHVAVAKSPRQLTQRPETSELTGLEIGLRSVRFHRPESRKNVPLSNPIPSAI